MSHSGSPREKILSLCYLRERGRAMMFFKRRQHAHQASSLLKKHFGSQPIEHLVTASRTYPVTSRVDVQTAFERQFGGSSTASLVGVHAPFGHEGLTIAHLATGGPYPVVVGPLQHEEIDVGESLPARCIKRGLWLARKDGLPFAVLLAPEQNYGQVQGVHVEVAVAPGGAGFALSRAFLRSSTGTSARRDPTEGRSS